MQAAGLLLICMPLSLRNHPWHAQPASPHGHKARAPALATGTAWGVDNRGSAEGSLPFFPAAPTPSIPQLPPAGTHLELAVLLLGGVGHVLGLAGHPLARVLQIRWERSKGRFEAHDQSEQDFNPGCPTAGDTSTLPAGPLRGAPPAPPQLPQGPEHARQQGAPPSTTAPCSKRPTQRSASAGAAARSHLSVALEVVGGVRGALLDVLSELGGAVLGILGAALGAVSQVGGLLLGRAVRVLQGCKSGPVSQRCKAGR